MMEYGGPLLKEDSSRARVQKALSLVSASHACVGSGTCRRPSLDDIND